MRYKLPNEDVSKLIEKPITKSMHDVQRLDQCGPEDDCVGMEIPNSETGFATAVASFGQLLKGGKYTGQFDYDDVIKLAKHAKGDDPYGYRAEFIRLVELAKSADAMRK
jgi:Ca-activated chloride channel family protein